MTEKSTTSTGLVAVADEDNIAFDTDHSGLVKYDTQGHPYYLIVSERIRRLAVEAKTEVARRLAGHST